MEASARGTAQVHPIVKLDYVVREIGCPFVSLVVVLSRLSTGEAMPVTLWVALVLYGLAWPQAAYFIGRQDPARSRTRELAFLLFDTAVGGAAIPLVCFQPVPTLTLLLPYAYFLCSLGGPRLLLAGIPAVVGGAWLTGWLFTGFKVETNPPILNTILVSTLLLADQVLLGMQTYSTARGFVKSRKRVAEQSEEIRQQNDQLVAAREEALQAAKAKAAFLATMSHEIRTPLNGVLGMSRLLQETPHTSEQGEFLRTIEVSGNTLLTVVNDILDYSRIESGRLELEEEPVHISEVVEEALEIVSDKARRTGIELVADVAPDVPRAVIGDATRLRQILTNLVNNAVKFTERGEVVVSVYRVDSRNGDAQEQIAVQVRDTGIGIPESRIGDLFAPFSQADASTTRKYGGTGLGLAICKRLVEIMGGSISVRSIVGMGTTFRLTLPVREAPAPTEIIPVGAHTIVGRRVLVVDDNEINRRVLRTQLANWGLESEGAEGTLQALEILKGGGPFDLAVLDLHMPEVDGMALAHRIRALPEWRAMPLILLSSSFVQAKDDPERLFCARLIKPVRQSRLFDALVRALGAGAPDRAEELSESGPHLIMGGVPLSILVADDNEINRHVAGLVFKRFGYEVEFAVNGRDAVDRVVHHAVAAEHEPFDVVFMDVHMPEMDGLEACRAIRRLADEQPERHWPRIVAMTADAMPEDRQLCLDAGMDGYLTKPLQFEAVRAAIEEAAASPAVAARGPRMSSPPARTAAPPGGPAAVQPSAEAVMDWSRLEALREFDTPDGAVVQGAIAAFVAQAPAKLAEVRSSIADRDGQSLRGSAHAMKGAASNIGAVAVAGLASRLEQAGRQQNFEHVDILVESLSTALVQTLSDLHRGPGEDARPG